MRIDVGGGSNSGSKAMKLNEPEQDDTDMSRQN
jgi:hypothetical protein